MLVENAIDEHRRSRRDQVLSSAFRINVWPFLARSRPRIDAEVSTVSQHAQKAERRNLAGPRATSNQCVPRGSLVEPHPTKIAEQELPSDGPHEDDGKCHAIEKAPHTALEYWNIELRWKTLVVLSVRREPWYEAKESHVCNVIVLSLAKAMMVDGKQNATDTKRRVTGIKLLSTQFSELENLSHHRSPCTHPQQPTCSQHQVASSRIPNSAVG